VWVEERRAVCPAGKESTQCSRLEEERTGKVSFRLEWSTHCHDCRLRSQCLGEGQRHRTLERVLKSDLLCSANAPQHYADHRKVKHSLRIFDFGFVVAHQAAVLHKPAESALHNPTPGQHFEPALVLETGDNFQAQAAGLAMRGDPGSKKLRPDSLDRPRCNAANQTTEGPG